MNDTRPRDYPPRGERLRELYRLGGLTAAVYLNYFAMVIVPCLFVYRQTQRTRAGVATERHSAHGLSRPREA